MLRKDLTGKSFGQWDVLEWAGRSKCGDSMWKCRCSCGTIKDVSYGNLVRGISKRCRRCNGTAPLDLKGETFGELTVVESLGMRSGDQFWLCRCSCGNATEVPSKNLRSGNSKRCKDCALESLRTGKPQTKHGHTIDGRASHTYVTWFSIINRCTRPSDSSYHHYGAKGVRVCQRWKGSFRAFLEDMGERASQKLSIDRANTSEATRHYSCGKCDECVANGWVFHCRWATKAEQMANRRIKHKFVYDGRGQSLQGWAKEFGIPYGTLVGRIYKFRWPLAKALETPRQAVRV